MTTVSFELIGTAPSGGTGASVHQVLAYPGEGDVLAVLDTGGTVWLLDGTTFAPSPLVDLSALGLGFVAPNSDAGLRSIAFHPDFLDPTAEGYRSLYLAYSATPESADPLTPLFTADLSRADAGVGTQTAFHDVVAEFKVVDSGGNLAVDPASGRELLRIAQPLSDHNIGQLGFDPSAVAGEPDYGLLYISVGDGGGSANPLNTAAAIDQVFGSILRIDPLGGTGGATYAIPATNPYANVAGALPEIYATGLRDPQSFSFHAGRLLVSDIGESGFEEVNAVLPGGQYGWDAYEGAAGTVGDGLQSPFAQYAHGATPSASAAIGPAFAYLGTEIGAFDSMAIFSDVPSGDLFLAPLDGLDAALSDGQITADETLSASAITLVDAAGETTDFATVAGGSGGRADLRLAQSGDGEIIAFSEQTGDLFRLTAAPAPASLLTGEAFAPLATAGNTLVDADGDTVFIKAINWYGVEVFGLGVTSGVEVRSLSDIMDMVADLGFNTIRLPFSTGSVLDPFLIDVAQIGYDQQPIDYELNPGLIGLDTLQFIEFFVEEAEQAGLSVILDNHFTAPGQTGVGYWYDDTYSEDDWVAAWETLAVLLADNPNVIGADLRNEPHLAHWTPYSTAMERAGNAIHDAGADWLIIVEGTQRSYLDGEDWYQWGGNLKDVRFDPIVLEVEDRLVYSMHEYSKPATTKLDIEGGSYAAHFEEFWGFVSTELNAPIFLGEFGFEGDADDAAWSQALFDYIMGDTDGDGVVDVDGSPVVGWAYWNLNPPEGGERNLLAEDFETVRPEIWDVLAPLMAFDPYPAGTGGGGTGGGGTGGGGGGSTGAPVDLGIALTQYNDWGNGATLEVTLTNQSAEAVPTGDIVLAFDPQHDATVAQNQIWRAVELAESTPDRLVFQLTENAAGGPMLEPGQSASFFVVLAYDGQWNVSSLGVTPATFEVLGPLLEPDQPNTAPAALDLAVMTDEDTPLDLAFATLLEGASDADGDTLGVSAVALAPQVGSVDLSTDGLRYTPAADHNGTDTFSIVVDDGRGGTDTAVVSVTINPVNDAPLADFAARSVLEDGTLTIPLADLLGEASDPEGDALSVLAATGAGHGTAGIDPVLGVLTYTPAPNYAGGDALVVTVADVHGATASATLSLTVTAVNDAPEAAPLARTIAEDTVLTVPVAELLAAVGDVDSDPAGFEITGPVGTPRGTVQLAAGTLTYTPPADEDGTDTVLLGVGDGDGGTTSLALTVTIDPVNDAPVPAEATVEVDEDGTVALPDLAALATDVEGDAVELVSLGAPSHGTLTTIDGTVHYSPGHDRTDPASIAYVLTDAGGASSTGTLTVLVIPENDAPIADPGGVTLDTASQSVTTHEVLAAASDADGDALHIVGLMVAPQHGSVQRIGDAYVYTRHDGTVAADQFAVDVADPHDARARVVVHVPAYNAPPTADPIAFTAEEDTPLVLTIEDFGPALEDLNGDALTFAEVGEAGAGSVWIEDGTVRYLPGADFHGADAFTFTVSDGVNTSAEASASITVLPVNDAPQIDDTAVDAEAGVPLTLTLADFAATDIDGDTLTLSIAAPPENGTVALTETGIVYTPAEGYSGPDTFTLMVDDGNSGTATAQVSVEVSDPGPAEAPFAFAVASATAWFTGGYFVIEFTNLGTTAIDPTTINLAFATDQGMTVRPGEVFGGTLLGTEPTEFGEIITFSGTHVRQSDLLEPGETGSIAFVADFDTPTIGLTLLAEAFSAILLPPSDLPAVAFALDSVNDWGNGAVVTVSMTNVDDEAFSLDDYAIAYDADVAVDVREGQVYRAELVDDDADVPLFLSRPPGGGRDLAPGESVDFMFVLDYSGNYQTPSLGADPSDFTLLEFI